MAQALKIRLPDGRTLVPSDWTSSPLYSTVEIDDASSLTPLPAFSYGIGGEVPGSVGPRKGNIADTNMQGSGGILAENEELLLYALQIELFQIYATASEFYDSTQELFAPDAPLLSLTNVLRLQRSTLVKLRIANTKDYCTAPLGFFPAAMGVQAVWSSARSDLHDTNDTYPMLAGSNGGVTAGDQREFATPHHVGGGEAFEVAFEFPYGGVVEPISGVTSSLNFGGDASARIRARVFAVGLRRRPVA